jgi:hypothetical protein
MIEHPLRLLCVSIIWYLGCSHLRRIIVMVSENLVKSRLPPSLAREFEARGRLSISTVFQTVCVFLCDYDPFGAWDKDWENDIKLLKGRYCFTYPCIRQFLLMIDNLDVVRGIKFKHWTSTGSLMIVYLQYDSPYLTVFESMNPVGLTLKYWRLGQGLRFDNVGLDWVILQ